MTPLEQSAQVKRAADAILRNEGFEALLKANGEVIYSGSYALDLMVWNDIDLYLVPKPGADWDECVSGVCAALIRRKDVDRVKVEKSFWKTWAALPQGIYIGVKTATKPQWKLDIWVVDEQSRAQNKALLSKVRAKLTPATRELIIRVKTELINAEGRTPPFSSVYVYQAVLEKGLTNIDEIKNYALTHDESTRKGTFLA